jgi:hypothetical protein
MNRLLKRLAILVLGWSLVAVLTTSQLYLEVVNFGQPIDLKRIFLTQLLQWNFWVVATPVIAWLGLRCRIESGAWGRALLVHIPASIVVAAAHVAWVVAVGMLLAPDNPNPSRPARSFWRYFLDLGYTYHIELLIYWAILGATYAIDYYRKYRERELRASQLEAQLAQANLQALRMQLQPHFLFNTLNAITTLVRDKQNQVAVEMIVGVSELLRQSLDNLGRHEVRLKDELEFIERYLEIQRMRFSDRLVVQTRIAPKTLDLLVPNLVLQPIVENAIRHGLSQTQSAWRLEIDARTEGDALHLSVFNNGVPLAADWSLEENCGLGLSTTVARLEQLYGPAQRFTLKNADGGVQATIRLPARLSVEGNDENQDHDR